VGEGKKKKREGRGCAGLALELEGGNGVEALRILINDVAASLKGKGQGWVGDQSWCGKKGEKDEADCESQCNG